MKQDVADAKGVWCDCVQDMVGIDDCKFCDAPLKKSKNIGPPVKLSVEFWGDHGVDIIMYDENGFTAGSMSVFKNGVVVGNLIRGNNQIIDAVDAKWRSEPIARLEKRVRKLTAALNAALTLKNNPMRYSRAKSTLVGAEKKKPSLIAKFVMWWAIR